MNTHASRPSRPPPPALPLVPERSDFLDGDAPAAAKVDAFLARALEATGSDAPPGHEATVTPSRVCLRCGAGRMVVVVEFPPTP